MPVSNNVVKNASALLREAELRSPAMQSAQVFNPLDICLAWIAASKQLVKEGSIDERRFDQLVEEAAGLAARFDSERRANTTIQ